MIHPSNPVPVQSSSHAVVIGGSMAGLLAARVLCNHFGQVTLIEQDPIANHPEVRRGQPQAQHLHGLLASGRERLESYFPGLTATLQAGGATLGDMGQDARWHIFKGYRRQYVSGMQALMCSRPFLEWHIRQRIWQLPNLKVLDHCRVQSLTTNPDASQVTGVRLQRSPNTSTQTLSADLVVDASGRNTDAPQWLAAFDYPPPPETKVTVNMGYATRIFRRRSTDLKDAKLVIISADPPTNLTSGVAFPIEENRWIVTLSSWGNQPLPRDDQQFLACAEHLPADDIYQLISQLEPCSDIVVYRYPASLRRHYEKLSRFPCGFLLLGDALCSFNPTYGQGMTSAVLQAQILDQLLGSGTGIGQLHKSFFQQTAKMIDIPWQLAVGEDFRFPDTFGTKAFGTDLLNWYAYYVHAATHSDPQVYTAFLRVMNLLAPPLSLFHPQLVWRVWQAYRGHHPVSNVAKFVSVRVML